MKSAKKVTIILPVYCVDAEVRRHLEHCIANLLWHTPSALFDLVVVENGSSVVPDIIGSALEYQYVWMADAVGYARAVNYGLRAAVTDYVCVLNSDVFVSPGWLEKMIEDYDSIPKCGVLAPNGPPGITFDSHWWSCVLIRKGVADVVGLLDESLPFMYHDQNWNICCRKAGFAVARTGNVQVEHIGRVTYGRVPDQGSAVEREEMIRRYRVAEFEEWASRENQHG